MEQILFIILAALVLLLGVLMGTSRLVKYPARQIIIGVGGSIIGIIIGALLSVPLSTLPSPYSAWLPLIVTAITTAAAAILAWGQRNHLEFLVPKALLPESDLAAHPQIIVDTSVIIDGRIADIAKTGFVPGKLLIPRFVLAELQNIADSDDAMRRGRGRRGLEMLDAIRHTPDIVTEIIEENPEHVKEVDHKLVYLAKKLGTDILTTDFNLNQVARIEGVRVLNINELSNAVRPVVLPGEPMQVRVVQPGKERNQGVGYLADGTMIVIEGGDKLIGQEIPVEVTRIFQTVAGKMIFAQPKPTGSTQSKNKASSATKQNNSRATAK